MPKSKLFPGLIWAGVIVSALLLEACVAPSAGTPTPDFKNMQTRIASTLAAIPTAESLTPSAPTASAAVATGQSSAPPRAVTTVATHVGTAEVTPAAVTPAVVDTVPQDYVVQSGDTLSTIAVRFNTSIAAIQLLNNLSDVRVVQQGRALKIPTSKLAADENPYWIVHVVEAGETLSTIAVRYGIPLDDLLRVNHITDPALTRTGDRLVIPASGPVS